MGANRQRRRLYRAHVIPFDSTFPRRPCDHPTTGGRMNLTSTVATPDTAQASSQPERRSFIKRAAGAAAAGAATLAFPMVARAQGPITMRWQSTWPQKDIFHEYALDFAKKVNDMTGGDLKIEVLPAGAVVPAFGLLDAVS